MDAPDRSQIDAEVLRWIAETPRGNGEPWRDDDRRFAALALRIFAWQFEHCIPYRRFCVGRERTPERVRDWCEIPAVPTSAFKDLLLTSYPKERSVHIFRTSGTTEARRGALHLDTLDVYEASLLPSFARHLLPDLAPGGRARLRILAPSPAESPDSSLSHMFGCALRELGDAGSGYDVANGALQVESLSAAVAEAQRGATPVALCGTAFAFVHLLDALAARNERLPLPVGSRIMETGGFKGRSRVLAREALYEELEARLAVPAGRIVNQYGMTELGSQFYDSSLLLPDEPRRKLRPPWTRVRLVDPETGRDAAPGDVGMIVIHDLANTGSVAALQTADLGRAVSGGFEVLGRAEAAAERGCSIGADAMLASV